MRVLLLEDDDVLGETIEALLKMEGYEVVWVRRGDDALDATYEGGFDLYIFDIGVPDIDGLTLLSSLREADDTTPALFISARTDIESIAKGFDAGAYDYIKKPFYPEELLVRIRARLQKERFVTLHGLRYDTAKRLLFRGDEPIALGEVQRCLLHHLVTARGNVVDKSELLECLLHPSDAALRVALNKLKQTTGLPIVNLRGVGYRLESG
ncbi:response regulator transcription factor [Hydrogenimonas sp.]